MEVWTTRIKETICDLASPLFSRAIVVEITDSTQDEALRQCGQEPGLVLVASRQSGGRGRLGRTWVQSDELGLAVTLVLRADAFPADRLSIGAGLAAAMTIDAYVGAAAPVGVRWPNDVVESQPRPGGGRKLAGVLVEVKSGLALVGIGINVNQSPADWPKDLRPRVVSARELAGCEPLDRCAVACALVRAVHAVLSMPMAELIPAWLARDVLQGSLQRFVCAGREVEGIVESLEPTGEIVVRDSAGVRVRLPAMTTSMVK